MKKRLILISALFVVAALFASCKKNCICTVTTSGSSVSHDMGEMTKSECESYTSAAWELPGITFKCELE